LEDSKKWVDPFLGSFFVIFEVVLEKILLDLLLQFGDGHVFSHRHRKFNWLAYLIIRIRNIFEVQADIFHCWYRQGQDVEGLKSERHVAASGALNLGLELAIKQIDKQRLLSSLEALPILLGQFFICF